MSNPKLMTERFCASLSSVFLTTLAREWRFECAPADNPSRPTGELLTVEFDCSPATGRVLLAISLAEAAQIAGSVLGEPIPPGTPLSEDQAQLIRDLLKDATGEALSQSGLTVREAPEPSEESAASESLAVLLLGSDEDKRATIWIRCDPSVVAYVSLRSDSKEPGTAEPAEPTLPPSAQAPPRRANPNANLGLLLDVELNVSLCFGRRKMALKEIAELGFGAIVELDREAQAPVDLMLGEKVIARGEVVIVDGNYGLKVTEVCASAEV